MANEKMKNKKVGTERDACYPYADQDYWREVFSQGDVYELHIEGENLIGEYVDDYDKETFKGEEVADNGISTFEERARIMGLKPVEVDYNGNPIKKEF